jgi:hypothetical protein
VMVTRGAIHATAKTRSSGENFFIHLFLKTKILKHRSIAINHS